MARRIAHQLVDDLDGNLLEAGDGETVLLSLAGVAYEIDLTDETAELRSALEHHTNAARPVAASGATNSGTAAVGRERRREQPDHSGVLGWVKQSGYQVSERGRVSASVLDACESGRIVTAVSHRTSDAYASFDENQIVVRSVLLPGGEVRWYADSALTPLAWTRSGEVAGDTVVAGLRDPSGRGRSGR